MGARLVLATRDKKRGEAALAPLRNAAPRIAHSIATLISPALRR